MQPEFGEEPIISLVIRANQLYLVSDELGVYSNELQIIGAMVAAIGNSLGVISSKYAIEGDRLQLIASFRQLEEESREGNRTGTPKAGGIRQYQERINKQMKSMDNRNQNQVEELQRQIIQLQRQIQNLKSILEQHINNS